MEQVKIKIGPVTFDRADYDADSDVIYLHVGEPPGDGRSVNREDARLTGAVCDHRHLSSVTYMYCFPAVLESEAGRVAVDAALACLATELEIDDGVRLRQGDGNSIVVRDVDPQDLWRAMDRAVPDWEDKSLFFAPVFL